MFTHSEKKRKRKKNKKQRILSQFKELPNSSDNILAMILISSKMKICLPFEYVFASDLQDVDCVGMSIEAFTIYTHEIRDIL